MNQNYQSVTINFKAKIIKIQKFIKIYAIKQIKFNKKIVKEKDLQQLEEYIEQIKGSIEDEEVQIFLRNNNYNSPNTYQSQFNKIKIQSNQIQQLQIFIAKSYDQMMLFIIKYFQILCRLIQIIPQDHLHANVIQTFVEFNDHYQIFQFDKLNNNLKRQKTLVNENVSRRPTALFQQAGAQLDNIKRIQTSIMNQEAFQAKKDKIFVQNLSNQWLKQNSYIQSDVKIDFFTIQQIFEKNNIKVNDQKKVINNLIQMFENENILGYFIKSDSIKKLLNQYQNEENFFNIYQQELHKQIKMNYEICLKNLKNLLYNLVTINTNMRNINFDNNFLYQDFSQISHVKDANTKIAQKIQKKETLAIKVNNSSFQILSQKRNSQLVKKQDIVSVINKKYKMKRQRCKSGVANKKQTESQSNIDLETDSNLSSDLFIQQQRTQMKLEKENQINLNEKQQDDDQQELLFSQQQQIKRNQFLNTIINNQDVFNKINICIFQIFQVDKNENKCLNNKLKMLSYQQNQQTFERSKTVKNKQKVQTNNFYQSSKKQNKPKQQITGNLNLRNMDLYVSNINRDFSNQIITQYTDFHTNISTNEYHNSLQKELDSMSRPTTSPYNQRQRILNTQGKAILLQSAKIKK